MKFTEKVVFQILLLILLLTCPNLFSSSAHEPPKTQEPRPATAPPIQDAKPDTVVSHPLQLLRFELTFENGRYYQVIKKGERPLRLVCRIVAQGQGTMLGMWRIDDHNVLPLQIFVSGFYDRTIPPNKLPVLPSKESGTHSVSLKLKTPQTSSSLPVLRYFVSSETPLKGITPESGLMISRGEDVDLSWTAVKGEYRYQLVVSQTPFQFLKDSQINWQESIPTTEWTLNTDSFSPGHVYWMIRAVSAGGRVVSASEINFFLIKEKPQTAEEVSK